MSNGLCSMTGCSPSKALALQDLAGEEAAGYEWLGSLLLGGTAGDGVIGCHYETMYLKA